MDHLDKTFAMIVGSQLAIRNMIPDEKRETFYEAVDRYKKASTRLETFEEEKRNE